MNYRRPGIKPLAAKTNSYKRRSTCIFSTNLNEFPILSISTWYQSKSDSKIPTIYTLFSADSKISSKWLHPFQPHWIYWGHFHFYQASGVVRVPQLTNDSSIVVTSHRLNGDNYLSWSRRIEMFITRKSKKRNTYMDSPIPSETDANFRLWKSENSMILSWLIRPLCSQTFLSRDLGSSQREHVKWLPSRFHMPLNTRWSRLQFREHVVKISPLSFLSSMFGTAGQLYVE